MTLIPNDPRAESSFEILHGLGTTAYRLDLPILDANVATTFQADEVNIGDFLRCVPGVNSTSAFTLSDVDSHVVGVNYTGVSWNMDAPFGIAWDNYDDVNAAGYVGGDGHPDANARDRLTVLTGEFVAKVPLAKFLAAATTVPISSGGLNFTAKTPAIGSKVVVCNIGTGAAFTSWNFGALGIDYANYLTGGNAAEVALLNAVVGQIINIEDATYAHIRFSL